MCTSILISSRRLCIPSGHANGFWRQLYSRAACIAFTQQSLSNFTHTDANSTTILLPTKSSHTPHCTGIAKTSTQVPPPKIRSKPSLRAVSRVGAGVHAHQKRCRWLGGCLLQRLLSTTAPEQSVSPTPRSGGLRETSKQSALQRHKREQLAQFTLPLKARSR